MIEKFKLPELYKYKELSASERLNINQILISYAWLDCLFNIHMRDQNEIYNSVKITSVRFENEATTILIYFETLNLDRIGIPIDYISKIEISKRN